MKKLSNSRERNGMAGGFSGEVAGLPERKAVGPAVVASAGRGRFAARPAHRAPEGRARYPAPGHPAGGPQ
ncbi:MAG: hypothetical protein AVDCRST_MAG27-4532 [uncultured Craurococcus sp.]|uniref:Uncharacterized protein n=1 Tax=uncultured Craurococcus sp. TaxID=1135998 RepID=A0A6J4JVT3_9PROT|nr:MAG: hypothetical protein AVDCRST_MAG27-4532 [uncultured Craurococcus sp.]